MNIDAIELNAIRQFASSLHDGGCQSPHGGMCGCGWNLIEARIGELRGESAERVAWLRQGVKKLAADEQELVDEIIAAIDKAETP